MAKLTMDALRMIANGDIGGAREEMDAQMKMEQIAEEVAANFFWQLKADGKTNEGLRQSGIYERVVNHDLDTEMSDLKDNVMSAMQKAVEIDRERSDSPDKAQLEKEAEKLAFSQFFCNVYEDSWPDKPFYYLEDAAKTGSLADNKEDNGIFMEPCEMCEDMNIKAIANLVADTKEHILAGMNFALNNCNGKLEKLLKENEKLRKEIKKLSKGKSGR